METFQLNRQSNSAEYVLPYLKPRSKVQVFSEVRLQHGHLLSLTNWEHLQLLLSKITIACADYEKEKLINLICLLGHFHYKFSSYAHTHWKTVCCFTGPRIWNGWDPLIHNVGSMAAKWWSCYFWNGVFNGSGNCRLFFSLIQLISVFVIYLLPTVIYKQLPKAHYVDTE